MRVAEICIIDVIGNPGELVVYPPSISIKNPKDATDTSTYIQYSSTVSENQGRTLTARWGEIDSAPSGCLLKLQAIPSGRTHEGNSAGEIVLSAMDQILLTGIKSCATGTGPTNGAKLRYTLTVDDPTYLIPGEKKDVTVIYTLTDTS